MPVIALSLLRRHSERSAQVMVIHSSLVAGPIGGPSWRAGIVERSINDKAMRDSVEHRVLSFSAPTTHRIESHHMTKRQHARRS